MKTLTLGIISLAFTASLAVAGDFYSFDVYSYDPDLDPDFLETNFHDPGLKDKGEFPLAIQQNARDADGGSAIDHTEQDGIINSTDTQPGVDI